MHRKPSVLSQINNPFIIPVKFILQSPEKIYFISPFVHGGELFQYLRNAKRFDLNRSRLYTAELLCALAYLHSFNFIYCYMEPQNILLDYSGYISLCNFGLYELGIEDKDSTNTFCTSLAYQAPELLLGQGYTETVDSWTLSVLLYEILTGSPLFYDKKTDKIKLKILSEPIQLAGPDIFPLSAEDILTELLNRSTKQRLGVNGAWDIKNHLFFHGIDWRKLLQQEYEPTFKPNDGLVNGITHSQDYPDAMSSQPITQYSTQEMIQQFFGWL